MAALSNATYGVTPDPAMDHCQIRIPAGTIIDGAVAELSLDERGIITADIRIPGPAA
jgi:hypothetical protein